MIHLVLLSAKLVRSFDSVCDESFYKLAPVQESDLGFGICFGLTVNLQPSLDQLGNGPGWKQEGARTGDVFGHPREGLPRRSHGQKLSAQCEGCMGHHLTCSGEG